MISKEPYKRDIINSINDANESNYSDVKLYYQLNAIAYGLMWTAEELHELNERSKDG